MRASKILTMLRENEVREAMSAGEIVVPFRPHMANGWLTAGQIEDHQFALPEHPYCHGGRYPYIYGPKGEIQFVAVDDSIRFAGGKREVVHREAQI